ncbi:MAG: hypothetical protein GX633_06870 [Clostridiales bacterium]|nr:hypothetical protein [Clostridiales bacterium]
MLNKNDLLKRIRSFQEDCALPGEAYAGLRTGMRTEKWLKLHKTWIEALDNCELLFSNGENGRVKYDSLRDIDFTGPEINNQEWRAQLNRYRWLQHLAYEYEETGNEKYAALARDSIEAWLNYRTFRGDETVAEVWKNYGDNNLSVSIRLGQLDYDGWYGSLPHFMGNKAYNEAFVARMERSAYEQMEFLKRNNTKHGNFRISELDTMMFISDILPGFEEYREYAVRNLNETFASQVEPDGSHQEYTYGYHTWMCDVFTKYAILSKNRPELGIKIDPERVCSMYLYTFASQTPDGRVFGINDIGRWIPDTAPADYGQQRAFYNRLRVFLGLSEDHSPLPCAFPDAGQYFFRHGNDAMAFDCSNAGGYHVHNARGSLLFYHGDRLQLCDPGSLNYEASDPFCAPGRMTPLHNTVTVNGWNQNQFANAVVPFCTDNDDLSFVQCVYSGGYTNYSTHLRKMDFGTVLSCAGRHIRTVLWIKNAFVVVYDTLDMLLQEYDFAAHWQLLDEDIVFDAESKSISTVSDGYNILITSPCGNMPTEAKLYKGDFERKLGYIAAGPGALSSGMPAPMLSIEGHVEGHLRPGIFTVIAPFEGDKVPVIEAECSHTGNEIFLDVKFNGECYHFGACSAFLRNDPCITQVGENGRLKSDGHAALICPDGRAASFGGTYVAFD